jgi:3-hydroxyisobutyrate dehydrogenase
VDSRADRWRPVNAAVMPIATPMMVGSAKRSMGCCHALGGFTVTTTITTAVVIAAVAASPGRLINSDIGGVPACRAGDGAVTRKEMLMAGTDNHGEKAPVAVLGTGIMGSAMARRLVAGGLRTTVWDRSPSATAALVDAGVLVAASPEEAAKDARVVITMLPTADVVDSVIFGGVATAFAEGAAWAQMGTIGVTATTEIAERLAQLRPDALFVDAPVSGSKGPAEAGQLLILASGPPAAEAIVSPAFSAIGRKTVWLGEAGQGSRMKLVVNAYMSILIEGVAEALELAGRLGIDDSKLAETIEGGPLDAPIADAKLHKMEAGDFAPEFPLEWALKDVDLAIGAAGDDELPLLAALSRQWRAAVDTGHGREDVSAARLALGGH